MPTFTDILSFNDQLVYVVSAIEKKAVITDSFSLIDGLSYEFPEASRVGLCDKLNFDDSVHASLISPLGTTISDLILFSDTLVAFLAQRPTLSEAITFLDAVHLFLAFQASPTDSLSFSDTVVTNLTSLITVVCSDTLSLSDSLAYVNPVANDYLRRFLNDKPGPSL